MLSLRQEERTKDLEMCPGDIEEALPNVDRLLSDKPKKFEFSNRTGAVNKQLPDSEHDPDGSMRFVAVAVSLSLFPAPPRPALFSPSLPLSPPPLPIPTLSLLLSLLPLQSESVNCAFTTAMENSCALFWESQKFDPCASMMQLAKPLFFGNLDEETVIDALAVLTLQRPTPAPFNADLDKVIHDNFDQIADEKVSFWHSAHARMCMRISDELRMGKQDKAVEMNQALVLSLGGVSARWEKEECYDYSLSMVEYVAENWDGPRAGLLDAWVGSGFIKHLEREQITQLCVNPSKLAYDCAC